MDFPLDIHHVSIDEMLGIVGQFHKFQWMVEVLLCIMQIPATFPNLIMYFGALTPEWRCTKNNTVQYAICNSSNIFPGENFSRCDMPRHAWEFVKSKHYSIITQYDISCSGHWMAYLTTSVYFFGVAIGSIFMGWLGDKVGRKRVLFISMCLLSIFGCANAFAPNIEWFLVIRFFVGIFRSGTSVFMVLLASELTGNEHRPLMGTVLRLVLPFAYCILGAKAYYIHDWKILFIVSSAPYILTVLFFKLVPESVRWLRLNGQQEKIEKIFEKVAKFNGKVIPPNMVLAPLSEDEKVNKAGICQIFSTYKWALKTTNISFAWMVFSMLYFGVSLAADGLGGSLYLNFILVSSIEFPAGIASVFLLKSFGRKRIIMCTMLIGSLGCIALAIVPVGDNYKVVKIGLGLAAKFFVTISYISIHTWTVEIFPTSVRAAGMGFTQTWAKIGAACAPVVAKALRELSPLAPFLFMGVAGCISAVLLAFLSETKGSPTRESITRRRRIAVINSPYAATSF